MLRDAQSAALIKTQREYRECSVLCFTESWLHSYIPDHSVVLLGFSTVRADKDVTSSGKKKGGEIALYVCERWYNPGHVHVKEQLCSPNTVLLTVGVRPYYLPQEFPSAIIISVYVPPSADAVVACDVIHSAVAQVQTQDPSAFIVITGYFYHVSLNKTLPTFHQYVDCPTRDYNTLDLLYANAKDAYNPTARGRSDHNLVLLTPKYVPLVQRQPVHTRSVRSWTQKAADALQDCFEMYWDVLVELYEEDLDNMTDCISEYIRFCEHTTMPTRTVLCFPNNKPWITNDVKVLLNKKKRAFRSGDRKELRRVQHELRDMLRACKDTYRRRLEAKLQQNNVRDVWTGMKPIKQGKVSGRQSSGSLERANKLNS